MFSLGSFSFIISSDAELSQNVIILIHFDILLISQEKKIITQLQILQALLVNFDAVVLITKSKSENAILFYFL